MKQRKLIAGSGVLVVLALAAGSTALAAGSRPSGTTVTVRVEGLHHTLLRQTKVAVHAGSLTRFGAPSGKCPDASAAGALDGATHHSWKAIWESSFNDYEVTSILGEAHTFSSKDFWELFVNNVAAQTGACETKVKPGQTILFAAVPQKGIELPLRLHVPTRAAVGQSFDVQVRALKGRRLVDVAGAAVSAGRARATTDARGEARITPKRRGTLVVHASKAGYVRGLALVPVA